ncbi:hypothetical protein H5410_022746 [Solanum commersonii]|uniref:Uncharacterized protein n=1 Tax=Solanum commersonii TaxID=4109 RepID=A0A9J5ZEX8_SOLCO|nr:hypothetical protein H5410_022746 [Solanum commersonii]
MESAIGARRGLVSTTHKFHRMMTQTSQGMSGIAPRRRPVGFYPADMDNMSSTQRSGKAVTSSSRKRVRTGTTIPPTSAVPRGQTQPYGAKAVITEDKSGTNHIPKLSTSRM